MSNVDAYKIKDVTDFIVKKGLKYILMSPIADEDLTVLRIVRPSGSQTSFSEIKKVQPKPEKPQRRGRRRDDDGKGDKPTRPPRFKTLGERRTEVAEAVREFCVLHCLYFHNADHNPTFAIYPSKEPFIDGQGPAIKPQVWGGAGDHLYIHYDLLPEDRLKFWNNDLIPTLAQLDFAGAGISVRIFNAPKIAVEKFFKEGLQHERARFEAKRAAAVDDNE